ncbi:MAG: DUF1559 domain-containing protein [Akkermansiaceae bacterium]|nr:DUF1559 domain-containing protein [Armatimonadota bacterium]
MHCSNVRTTNEGFPVSITRRSQSAFTLIELLVVIAIIAILAAILFPVFAQARDKARQASCMSNQKQIGLGLIQYIQDFDELFPLLQDDTPNGFYWWGQLVRPYMSQNSDAPAGTVYNCPSFPKGDQWMQYGLHYDLRERELGRVPEPSETVMVAEKGQNSEEGGSFTAFMPWEWLWTDTAFKDGNQASGLCSNPTPAKYDLDRDIDSKDAWSWPNAAMPRYRHAKTGNFIFVDGHVKAIPRGRLDWCRNIYIKGEPHPFGGTPYPY